MQKWRRNVPNAYHKLWRKTKGKVKCIFSTFAIIDCVVIIQNFNFPENKKSNNMFIEVYYGPVYMKVGGPG